MMNELRVTLDAASRYHRNYYAWTHRIWLVRNVCHECLDILHCDLVVTKSWAETHISDYSCFQYRQFLFEYLHDQSSSNDSNNQDKNITSSCFNHGINHLLVTELDMLNSLFNLYSDQESLFMHRRFVLYCLCKWFPTHSEDMRTNELTFIDEQLSKSYSICKLNQWQLELIRRHVNYLKRVLNWDCESV